MAPVPSLSSLRVAHRSEYTVPHSTVPVTAHTIITTGGVVSAHRPPSVIDQVSLAIIFALSVSERQ